jgi:hypothetical protein
MACFQEMKPDDPTIYSGSPVLLTVSVIRPSDGHMPVSFGHLSELYDMVNRLLRDSPTQYTVSSRFAV